jgi:hypothetical protein
MHITLDQGLFDLLLILIGFLGRSLIQFRLPAMVICLILDMARWYMKTHPHGQEIAKQSNIDEKIEKFYPDAVG